MTKNNKIAYTAKICDGVYIGENVIIEDNVYIELPVSTSTIIMRWKLWRDSHRRNQLQVLPLDRDVVWLDAGTADSLMDAGQTIRAIQAETGRYVGCLEELALN